jgi:spermidine synthase
MRSSLREVHAQVAPRRSKPTLIFWLYPLFFLSGISGLILEVVWVRMLTRVLGSTVYATSTVLTAFMARLALGSFFAGRLGN